MPRRSSERANPVRRSAARVRTSGSAGWTCDARTSSSTADIAERRVDLGVELLAERALDARAQLRERVELARRAGELVVELRQHLLLHLAHRDLDASSSTRPRAGTSISFVSPGRRADERRLDLGREPPAAELDDGVPLRLAVRVDEIDDERVAGLRRAVARRRELGDRLAERLDLGVDGLLRHLDLGARNLERVQSTSSGSACTSTVATKLQASSALAGSSNSYCGSATGRTRLRDAALQNQPPMWLSTASA